VDEFIKSPTKPRRGISLCGLDETKIRHFIKILEALYHAIDEEDWERIKGFKNFLEEITELTEVMTKAGCMCPPHRLIAPDAMLRLLKESIQMRYRARGLSEIAKLLFALVGDI